MYQYFFGNIEFEVNSHPQFALLQSFLITQLLHDDIECRFVSQTDLKVLQDRAAAKTVEIEHIVHFGHRLYALLDCSVNLVDDFRMLIAKLAHIELNTQVKLPNAIVHHQMCCEESLQRFDLIEHEEDVHGGTQIAICNRCKEIGT